MPCIAPIPAVRLASGDVSLRWKDREAGRPLAVPCGTCLGCMAKRARDWSIRCIHENYQHQHACWITMTYDDNHLPPTLQKYHLQGFLKRLRSRTKARLRFFACGEYGEHTLRPHYHAILFGLRPDAPIQESWPHGHTRADALNEARISYTAGYTAKKLTYKLDTEERIDYATGECYTYQPPFLQMSRRPGIGAAARQHLNSWRRTTIHNDNQVPAPRYLHNAWKDNATLQQLAQLESEIETDQIEQQHQRSLINRTRAQELTAQHIILQRRLQAQTENRQL